MVSNKRNGKRNTLRASTNRGKGTAQVNRQPRRKPRNQDSLESVRSMIVKGKLGIFKLVSMPQVSQG
jgi:hypothetical protein